MHRRERYIARLDEVTITRKGDGAIVEYREQGVPATHLRIGPDLFRMTDERILEIFNESLRAQARLAAEYKHVVIEVPLGSPQMKYAEGACQWVPRGHVLRCAVGDDEAGQLVVGIDEKELDLEEFGRMLLTYAGWGMRIEFVPEDEVHRRPAHVVREPDPRD
jgi:hypothetical protein